MRLHHELNVVNNCGWECLVLPGNRYTIFKNRWSMITTGILLKFESPLNATHTINIGNLAFKT